MQPFDDQRMRQREHQRSVAMRARRDPFGFEEAGGVVAHRADVAELDARRLDLLEPAARRVLADTAGRDLRVARWHSTEHHDQVRMIGDALPTGAGTVHRLQTAEHVLHEHRAGGVAVGIARAGESADAAEEPLQLRSRVMKTSRAAPSVRAGVDCLIATIANDALDFIGDQIERAFPGDGHVTIGAATLARTARAVVEPSRAHGGLRDSAMVMQRIGNRRQHRRWIRIPRERPRLRHASIDDDRLKRAPVRMVKCGRGFFRHRAHAGGRFI